MLHNIEIHKSCFCYGEGEDMLTELKELARNRADTVDLCLSEIVFIRKGTLRLTVENYSMSRELEAGEFIFLPVGTRLSYKALSDCALLIFRLAEKMPECHVYNVSKISCCLDANENHRGIYTLKTEEHMQHHIAGVQETLSSGLKCRIYMQLDVSKMLFLLHAYHSREECVRFFSSILSPDMGFSESVRLNFMKHRTIADLAASMGMSRQQFSCRFRKAFGMNPHEGIQAERAKLIYQAICQCDKSLKEIAFEYDFPILSNFFRFCRQAFSKSPGEIRKSLKKAQ